MASTSRQHDCEREPDGQFTQVSGHIYELYRPNEGPAQVEILFFHGLQLGDTSEAYLTTWTNEKKELWPATWLPQMLPQARILSVSYDANMKKTSKQGRLDLYNLAENLTYDIGIAGIGQTSGCPVILVGHCIGGLVIKKLCTEAHKVEANRYHQMQKMTNFLKNLGGIFFYGTPHHGEHFVDLVSRRFDGPLLEYVRLLNKEAARLDSEFSSVCQKLLLDKKIASVGESYKTKIRGVLDVVMVSEGSARYGDYLYTLDADHFTICKPESKTAPAFKILLQFIRRIKPEEPEYAIPDNFQQLPRTTFGLDLKVEEILKMLTESKMLGIVGMGGIGKTTLVKAVFNKLCSSFDFTCFVPEVKLISWGVEAKEKEANKLMCYMGNASSGHSWCRKKLLLVFDDISDDDDIRAFKSMRYRAGPDSVYMVTCRDEKLLNRLEDMQKYPMLFLTDTDAERLFKNYAFPNESEVPLHLDKHVKEIVKKSERLPLTIEVLGQCLKGEENEKIWEQMLTALEVADTYPELDSRVWKKLKYSYDNLSPKLQGMFLDATTFFAECSGYCTWKLYEAKAAWSKVYGCEDLLWQTLVDKSLVYAVKANDKIRVHEQLKSLGKKIAREGSSCRRVWDEEEGLKALCYARESNYQGIECLRLSLDAVRKKKIPREVMLQLKTLKYLEINPESKNGEELTIIRLLSCLNVRKPDLFPVDDLVALRTPTFRLGPALRIDFGHLHNPRMVVLDLDHYSKTCLPKSIVRLASLKIFKIRRAPYLQTLPDSLGNLSALQSLKFSSCAKLQTLPDSFGSLSALQSLKFHYCDKLQTLPDSFGSLSALQSLEFYDCDELQTLPDSFGNLSALQSLKISLCHKLQTLPDSFGNLSALQSLKFFWCKKLQTLPDSFGSLSALQSLEFYWCGKLQTLPDSFGNLSALQSLKFNVRDKLQTLPDSFGNLSALQSLKFSSCAKLQTLPDSFGSLSALQSLKFHYCDKLQTLPDSFGNLSALQSLEFYDCDELQTLPDSFGNLSALQSLEFYDCDELQTLPDSFGNLSALQSLEFYDCDELQTLPDSFGNLSALQSLEFYDCDELQTLPDSFGNLSALQSLKISLCHKLQTLPDSFGNLSALQSLKFKSCVKLQTLSDSFGNLSALQSLKFDGCDELQTLPDSFGNLSALQSLKFDDCDELQTLPDSFGNLSALQSLKFNGCDKLQTLPDSFGNLSALQSLKFNGIESLQT